MGACTGAGGAESALGCVNGDVLRDVKSRSWAAICESYCDLQGQCSSPQLLFSCVAASATSRFSSDSLPRSRCFSTLR